MRVFRYVLFASVCLGFLLCLGSPLMAQQGATPDPALEAAMRAQQEAPAACVGDFNGPCCDAGLPGPPCQEVTSSLGKYRIYVSPKFRPDFAGCLTYQNTICGSSDFRLESPNLFDSATVVGRSAAHTQGSPVDTTTGTPVGDALTLVKDSDFTVMPSLFQGPVSLRREIHTEIVNLNMMGPLTGSLPKVRAGLSASSRPKSFGEVQSKNASGLPINDFAADSFFDVFVEVDLPPCGVFPGGTVYNQQALLVVNDTVGDLPPQVVYIHGNSSFVAVYFKFASTGSPPVPWAAGNLLGWLSLAGHGVGGVGEQELESHYCAATEMTGTGACCLPATRTCEMLDEAGCTDSGGIYAGNGISCTSSGPCGNCCLPNGECQDEDACLKLGGRYLGPAYTLCYHDPAGNCIPTVTEWGLVVMAMLVLTAATVVIMRRRAIRAG